MPFHRTLVGVLSLLLPGLGQIYCGRLLVAVGWFTGFAALLWFVAPAWQGYALLLWVALAAGDAYRLAPSEGEKKKLRIFSAFGMFVFFFWFQTFASGFLPWGTQALVNQDAEKFLVGIRRCRSLAGEYPSQTAQCGGLPSRDPWGTEYRYLRLSSGFEVRSAGPDRLFDSEDDLSYRYR